MIDHYSRKILAIGIFKRPPTSKQVCDFLDSVVKRVGRAPRYTVTDKGCQFWKAEVFKNWLSKHEVVKNRFGAIGKYGSIAVVKRFNRTLKTECTRRIIVPYAEEALAIELLLYIEWCNEY